MTSLVKAAICVFHKWVQKLEKSVKFKISFNFVLTGPMEMHIRKTKVSENQITYLLTMFYTFTWLQNGG